MEEDEAVDVVSRFVVVALWEMEMKMKMVMEVSKWRMLLTAKMMWEPHHTHTL